MGKCIYKLDNRTYETTLYCDSVGLVFNINMQFTKYANSLIPDGSFRFVDVVSVLQAPNGVEVAYNVNGVFHKFMSSKSANDLIDILSKGIKPIFLGTRPVDVNATKAMQYIFAYNTNYLNVPVIEPSLK